MKSLKEWATVISALETGDQTVLLRKGGILETASGFKLESERFFLFPTAEHQGRANIKVGFQSRLEQARANPPKEGHNRITSYAEVLAESDISSEEVLGKLSKFHIWSKAYIEERRRWKEEKPMKALFLRVFRIPERIIPLKPEYQGCKSWIDINEEILDGEPVLDDAETESRLREFREITG